MEVVHKASGLEAVPELIPELEALTSRLQATDVSQCVWVLGAAMRAHGAAGSRGNVFVANAAALVCLCVEYMLLAWAGWPSILLLPFCGQLSCSHWVARCQLQPLGGRTAPDLPAHPSPAGSTGFPKRAAADYRGVFHAGRAAYAAPLLFAHHTSGHGAAGACTAQPVSVPLFNDVACVCAFSAAHALHSTSLHSPLLPASPGLLLQAQGRAVESAAEIFIALNAQARVCAGMPLVLVAVQPDCQVH